MTGIQTRIANLAAGIVERGIAISLLVVLAPLLLVNAACIIAESGPPALFAQTRVGQYGRRFRLLKFRTMRASSTGTRITAGRDSRVTRVGAFLRAYKLDELPQLWNIAAGDMRFVGPRPDVPAFVDESDQAWLEILNTKPGLTDFATLIYRNEEAVLAQYADAETGYREEVLPVKLELSRQYIRNRSFVSDCRLILLTIRYSLMPVGFDAEAIKKKFRKEDVN